MFDEYVFLPHFREFIGRLSTKVVTRDKFRQTFSFIINIDYVQLLPLFTDCAKKGKNIVRTPKRVSCDPFLLLSACFALTPLMSPQTLSLLIG